MMSLGSSKSWHDVISKVLPKPEICAEALLEYYAPIIDWVKAKNKENKVKIGWNESKKSKYFYFILQRDSRIII